MRARIDKKIKEKADEEARKDCYMKEKTKMVANEERELKKYIWEQLKVNRRTIFEVRTNMIKIGANFGEKVKRCELSGKEETIEHIFKCCWSQDHIQPKMYQDIMVKIKEKKKEEIREIAEALRKTLKEREQLKEILKG